MLTPQEQPSNETVVLSDVLGNVGVDVPEQTEYYIHKSGAGALLTLDHIQSSGGEYTLDDYRLATGAEVIM